MVGLLTYHTVGRILLILPTRGTYYIQLQLRLPGSAAAMGHSWPGVLLKPKFLATYMVRLWLWLSRTSRLLWHVLFEKGIEGNNRKSLVDINALKETHKWVQDVCTERDDDIIIVLVANIDLNNKRQISADNGKEKSRDLNGMFDTSAKTGIQESGEGEDNDINTILSIETSKAHEGRGAASSSTPNPTPFLSYTEVGWGRGNSPTESPQCMRLVVQGWDEMAR
ncbi:ras-related protein Rab-6A isoform X1 [Prionailurus iriomotensis]